MFPEKFKVTVETNTNIRFITAIPTTQTISQILPILLKKYQSVAQTSLNQEGNAQQANCIKQISKNGFLIPLEDEVIDIFNDNDHLFINLGFVNNNVNEEKTTKREKLESKRKEKSSIEQKIKQFGKIPVDNGIKPTEGKGERRQKQQNRENKNGKNNQTHHNQKKKKIGDEKLTQPQIKIDFKNLKALLSSPKKLDVSKTQIQVVDQSSDQ